MLLHLLEAGDAELCQPPAALPGHQLQALVDAALRSSSVAASPHVDVLGDGVLAAVLDKRRLVQLVTAAKGGAPPEQQVGVQRARVDARAPCVRCVMCDTGNAL